MRRTATARTLGAAVALLAAPFAALLGSGAAQALSGAAPTPPAGQLPATAPGGTQGLAGPRNVEEAVRSGQAYPAAPKVRQRRPPPSERDGPVPYAR